MTRTYILEIDQGTTGSTTLVYRRDGRFAERGYTELPQIFPRPGWVAHDPSELLRTSLAAIRQALVPRYRRDRFGDWLHGFSTEQ